MSGEGTFSFRRGRSSQGCVGGVPTHTCCSCQPHQQPRLQVGPLPHPGTWHMKCEVFHEQGFGVWPLRCSGGCCRTGGVGLGQRHLLQGHPASFRRHCEPGCKCVCSLLSAGTTLSRHVPCRALLVNILNYRDLQR